jgi:uncharacterized cofD-like protein
VFKGQHGIDIKAFAEQRPKIWLEPEPDANPKALQAIKDADLVVIAPGSLYTSLGAVLVVPGVGRAIKRARAKKVYVCNLVNKPGQTDGFTIIDFADELERLAGVQFLDYALYNTRKPDDQMLKRYAADGELPVIADKKALKNARFKAVGTDLLAREVWVGGSEGDALRQQRTLIRHDPDKLARRIAELAR